MYLPAVLFVLLLSLVSASAPAADAVSGASAWGPTATAAPLPPDEMEPSEETAAHSAILAIAIMGIALACAMFYWTRKIGREGYHKTNSSYPGEAVPRAGDTRTTNITTPIP